MKLFAIGNGSVSDYLRSNISSLKDKIASYTDEQIMNSDFDEWVEYLTKKYQVEPITFFVNATTRSLHETTIQQYNPWSRMGSAYGEPEYYNLDGYNIDFKIPFAGDSILLKCQPSTYTFTSYEIVDFQRSTESSYGYIKIRLSYTNQEIKSFGEQLEEKIDTAFKNRFKNFEETSGYVNNEVRSYNEQLESTVRQLLNERKNKASDFFSISKALKIPLNLNSSAPNLTPIPLKKPHRANLNEPKQHAPEKQYYIDDPGLETVGRTPPHRKVWTDAPGIFKRSPPSQIEHIGTDRRIVDISCRPERTGTGTVRHYYGADESYRGRDRGIKAYLSNRMGTTM